MNPFEEELKNRFKDATSTEGLDSDMIWEGISGTLPNNDSSPTGRSMFIKKYPTYLFALLLAFGLAYLFFYLSKKEVPTTAVADLKEVLPKTEQLLTSSDKASSTSTTTNNQEIAISGEELNSNINDQTTSEHSAIKNTLQSDFENEDVGPNEVMMMSDVTSQKQGTVKENNIRIPNTAITSPEEITSLNANNQLAPLPLSAKSGLAEVGKSVIEKEIIKTPGLTENRTTEKSESADNIVSHATQQKENPDSEAIAKANTTIEIQSNDNTPASRLNTISTLKENNFNTLKLTLLESEISSVAFGNLKEIDLSSPVIPLSKKGRNRNRSIGFSAGLIAWSDYFQSSNDGSFKQLLKETNRSYLGQSFALDAKFDISKKLHITTGFEYLNARTLFNSVQTSDSVMYVSNVLIDAIATRTVKHYNQQKVLSIPIMVGTSKDFGSFELGINAGVGLNYIINQKGKSLNSELIISEYNQSNNNPVPYQSFFVSYQLQAFLGYRLTERFALEIQPDFRYQRHGESGFYGVGLSSIVWGLSVGGRIGF